ncbi:VWA domain-containing protein [Saccharothrix australiensis]|uniref:von Willebrand factor type A domain-containing protein n=1 Tax=Saccharothrix australiensis TaxID=2072 RepID=A0A495W383_9PSEU|nr:VWA domain-containing protein [Saccharothrix australiensis]RKT56171.1 hypothetical protein C8E97_4860 [Saccharothrix australiensis]
MTRNATFAARYWAALTGGHPPGRRGAGGEPTFGRRYLAALSAPPPIAPRVGARANLWRLGSLTTAVVSGLTALFSLGAHVVPLTATSGAGTHLEPVPAALVAPAEVVVLVDQPAGPEALAREREATALIAAAEVSPLSSVTVLGYDGGPAVEVVCGRTVLAGEVERERLAECARTIPARQSAGDGHAPALARAVAEFEPTPAAHGTRLVFLLTGATPDRGGGRTPAPGNAASDLGRALASAREKGVRVEPIGFGGADRRVLDGYAAGASPCPAGGAPPRATVVADSKELPGVVLSVLAARCATGAHPVRNVRLTGRDEVVVPVHVPAGASSVAITVAKGDGRVAAAYSDPTGVQVPRSARTTGRPAADGRAGGAPDAVEVLRVAAPRPGPWHVHLTAPDDAGDWTARVGATWAAGT